MIQCPSSLKLEIMDVATLEKLTPLTPSFGAFDVTLPAQMILGGNIGTVIPEKGNEIYHGNWHFCRGGQFCNPFIDTNTGLLTASIEESKATDFSERAVFNQSFVIPEEGLFQMIAHVQFYLDIDANGDRGKFLYDAASAITSVAKTQSTEPSDSSNASTSSGLIMGIIFSLVAVIGISVAIIIYQRKKKHQKWTSNPPAPLISPFANPRASVISPFDEPNSSSDYSQDITKLSNSFGRPSSQQRKQQQYRPSSQSSDGPTELLGSDWNSSQSMISTSMAHQSPYSLMDSSPSSMKYRHAFGTTNIDSSKIQLLEVIGSGSFGEVWKGIYSGSDIAVKRLHTYIPEAETDTFINEIRLIMGLRHPNIIQFIGTSEIPGFGLSAVTEYMAQGDLTSVLKRSRDSELLPMTWEGTKIHIALGIALGLAYLHGLDRPVIHRDLKSRNILISDSYQAKLTDFGLSRCVSTSSTMTVVGSNLWLAPEMIRGEKFTEKADVFSFGVVLTELDTAQLPYANIMNAPPASNTTTTEQASHHQPRSGLSGIALAHQVAYQNLRPQLSVTCLPKIKALAEWCMHPHPISRPCATEALKLLREVSHELSASSSTSTNHTNTN